MVRHVMKLNPSSFNMIRSGNKTIELRLYDKKRKNIQTGDIIQFINTDDPTETLNVKVTNLFRFNSFKELYRELPLLNCGYTEENIKTASPDDMDKYYTKEQQEKYGVVGIQIVLIKDRA